MAKKNVLESIVEKISEGESLEKKEVEILKSLKKGSDIEKEETQLFDKILKKLKENKELTKRERDFISGFVYSEDSEEEEPSNVVPHKSRLVAVLLAVFLNFFTWLYTYKFDAGKFWTNLVLTIITFGYWGIVSWFWAVIDAIVKDEDLLHSYYHYEN